MIQLNRVTIAGNLTRDPVVKMLQGDKCVAQFALAINKKWKDEKNVVHNDVTFVEIEAWNGTAELVGKYLFRGDGALIEGRLKLDSWTDKATGDKRHALRVVADTVHFTGKKSAETVNKDTGEVTRKGSDHDANPPF